VREREFRVYGLPLYPQRLAVLYYRERDKERERDRERERELVV
jgi:hypothetical protein